MPLKYDLNNRISCFSNKCSGMRICDCSDLIQTKSFNDFVLKRVINNGLTGSSWRFNRFNYINVKTTTIPIENLVR